MSNARKIKGGYWVVGYRDAVGKCCSRGFGKGRDAKKQAERFAKEIDFKKAHDQPLPLSGAEGIYLDDLCQVWVNEKMAQGRKSAWLQDWLNIFNSVFSPPLCKKPAHNLTQADVIAVVGAHYQRHSQATRNRYIGYLKSILEYGVEQKHLPVNPLGKWKKGKEHRRKTMLTLEALKSIQRVAPPHLAWALDVAWNIPARPGPSDLFALRFDRHFKPDRGGVEVFHSKVGRWSFIQLNEEFMSDLVVKESQHRSGHFIEYKGKPVGDIGKALEGAARTAELPYPVCMYDIRHLWITTALDSGYEMSVIAYMAGTSVEMIQKNYYEPHAAEREKMARDMPQISEPKVRQERKVVGIKEAKCCKTRCKKI